MSTENPHENDTQAALLALADALVMVPQAAPSEDGDEVPEGAITLPVIEQEGKRFIPVFTSRASLEAAGADPTQAVTIPVAELAANWPPDDLWLAVDPSTEEGLALPSDVVRALPGISRAGRTGQSGGEGGDTGEPGRSPTA
ncbi:SseB family protein [Streptomyces sp. NPDC046197]|uniref:SseB family protein n=1 Tax=Streptomyces sp. NPDC046197 TaxID=3154337 RepID=UPI003406EC9F